MEIELRSNFRIGHTHLTAVIIYGLGLGLDVLVIQIKV